MYLYIIFSSLFNSLLIGLSGSYFGRQNAVWFSNFTLLSSFFFILVLLQEILLEENTLTITLYTLFIADNIKLDIGFFFDQLTIIMLLVILSISSFVHLFTAGYMAHDPYIVRFYSYLGFFTFFMIILVTADNFLQLFVGWEGVGVCSYLLINF